jgi:Tol biopolymer transport system component
MNADGSDKTNISDGPENDYDPAWSPDGARIAFSSYRFHDNEDAASNQDIYTMNADGSDVTRLTDNPYDVTAPD